MSIEQQLHSYPGAREIRPRGLNAIGTRDERLAPRHGPVRILMRDGVPVNEVVDVASGDKVDKLIWREMIGDHVHKAIQARLGIGRYPSVRWDNE